MQEEESTNLLNEETKMLNFDSMTRDTSQAVY